MKQLLLVKMSSLGDVVHALPAVSDAVAAGWQVDWVVEEAFADIARAHPGVRRVIPIAWRRWRRNLSASRQEMRAFYDDLRTDSYDAVVDSQGLIKSTIVSLCARGPKSGFSHTSAREPWSAFFYGRRIQVARHRHAIERQRLLLSEALQYVLGDDDPGLGLSLTPGRRILLLHGTTWRSKHWPDGMWAELISLIKQAGYEPVVTFGNIAEESRAERLVQAGATLLPQRPLAELITDLRSMAAVITVDSGIGHLAATMGVPTLGLYGPTDGTLTGTRGPRADHLQGEAACVPCLKKRCRYRGEPRYWNDVAVSPPCFAALAPDRVWQATRALIAS